MRQHVVRAEAGEGRPGGASSEKVERAAKILNLTQYLERTPKQLSGGQRQRVAIGRAIVRAPKVFLFDEPLSNLDAALRGQTRVEIANLHRSLGATTIYVTHDQIEAMTLADRVVVLRDGTIEQVGSPLDLYDRPANQFVAQFIGTPQMNVATAAALPAMTRIAGSRLRADGFGRHPAGIREVSPTGTASRARSSSSRRRLRHADPRRGRASDVHLRAPERPHEPEARRCSRHRDRPERAALLRQPGACIARDAAGGLKVEMAVGMAV